MNKKSNREKLTVKDAAKRCGRNSETVRRWIWSGKLPAEKLGNQLFIRASDFEIYCREAAVKPYRADKGILPASSGSSATKSPRRTKEEIDDLFERMKALRERIRARMGRDFTEDEVLGSIRALREGRDRDIFGLR